MKPTFFVLAIAIASMVGCKPIQLAIPEQFSSQAVAMPVKGLNGFTNRPLNFGNFSTSKIKHGGFGQMSKSTWEQQIVNILGVEAGTRKTNEKSRYRYTINDGRNEAEVYCQEIKSTQSFHLNTNVSWMGDISRTNQWQYCFSSAIRPIQLVDDFWQVKLFNNYDRRKDTARKIFDLPYVEEIGFATNGKDTLQIKPVRINNFTTPKGRETKMPVKILTAYELRLDDGVVAIIDTFSHTVWMYKELDAPTKLIIASVSSALLLRKVQDVTG